MSIYESPVILVGAVSKDAYPSAGTLPPEPHIYDEGGKAGWAPEIEEHYRDLKAQEAQRVNSSNAATSADSQPIIRDLWGGNVLNTGMTLKATELYPKIGLVTVRNSGPEDDDVSAYLETHGIADLSVRTDDHVTSRGMVYRAVDPQSGHIKDRMIFGRPRTPMDGPLPYSRLRGMLAGSGVVVLASPKSMELTRSVLHATPDDALLSVNPGSADFEHSSPELREAFAERNPTILACNIEELLQFLGLADQIDYRTLTRQDALELAREAASRYAENVLCTMGLKGVVLAHRLAAAAAPAQSVPAELVEDTTGAGDTGHQEAIHSFVQGVPFQEIPRRVAASTAQAVQYVGGHGQVFANSHES